MFLSEMADPQMKTGCDGECVPASNTLSSRMKPSSVSWLKVTGINLLAFGMELCACAGFTYIPPILLKRGFSDRSLTIVMGIGPFLSLLLVPVIGHWSDTCQSRFGRRRPFMLALGLIMIISLLVIPFSNELFDWCHTFFHPNLGLATGVILLDFSSQALLNPCKSLIPDIFHTSEEQNSGFTFYSCMLSLGGCVGYFITSFDWTSSTLGIFFGGQEKAVFSLLAVVLLFLLTLNLYIAKEEPLERCWHLSQILAVDKNSNGISSKARQEESEEPVIFTSNVPKIFKAFKSCPCKSYRTETARCTVFLPLKVRYFVRVLKSSVKQLLLLFLLPLSIIRYSVKEFFKMPPVLFRLFIACLFGWMGIMCHDMYYSDFVGQVIYRGEPHAERESVAINLYDEGVRMGSWGLLFHCLCAALYAAFIQENLIYRYGKHKVYLFGMLSFSLSLLGTVFSNSLILVNAFAALSGLGLAAITTIPYSLITDHYTKRELNYCENKVWSVGKDMAVLDSAFYLSQIIPSLFLGYIVEYTKSSSTYMVVAAACGAAAVCFAYFAVFVPQSDTFSC